MLSGVVACVFAASLSAVGCGGLADERRGAPVAMFGGSGGTSGPSDDDCNPFIGNGCEMPVGCAATSPRCPPPTASSTGDAPVPREPPPPDVSPQPELPPESAPLNLPPDAAENVLASVCGQCHGPLPESADFIQGGLGNIQDYGALREAGYIVDCSPESSRIIQVMRSGSMPPPSSGLPRVTEADIGVVASTIELDCTDSERLCAGDPALPGCGAVLAELALERACGDCHGERARGLGSVLGGMSYVDDMAQLIENAQVVPCQSEVSPLLARARDGSMPAPSSRFWSAWSPRVDAVVASFIDGLCPGPASPEQLQVEGLLGTYCGDCHGQRAVELGQVQGGMDDIESVDALIRAGRLVPCVSNGSLIIQRMRDGSMPPPASLGPRPSDAEIQLIADFVDRPCAGP